MLSKLKENWKLILITSVAAFLLGSALSDGSSSPSSPSNSSTRTHTSEV